MKRKLSLILALLTVASLAASCSSDTSDDAETTGAEVNETTAAEETTAPPEMVIEKQDLGGMEFVIFGVEPHNKDWMINTYSEAYAETENGDLINDAIFKRNIEVEEAYNIKIAGKGVAREKVGEEALKVIMSGDDIYDVIHITGATMQTLVQQPGSLYNLYDIDSIDLSHSWWDQNCVEDLTIGNIIYTVAGDMNIRNAAAASAINVNLKMIEDYSLTDPFAAVEDGTWTSELVREMSKTVTIDLDNDGVITIEDSAGFFGEATTLYWGMVAFGETIAQVKNGTPEITLDSERIVKAVEYYVELLRSGEYGIYATDVQKLFAGENIWRTRMLPMFEQNKLLFYNGTLSGGLDLRNMEADFGIVPMPKLDESQDEYYASLHPAYTSMMCIPSTNPDTETTGLIMETLNFLSQQYVMPAFFGSTLTDKVLRNEASVRMLELISSSRVYDLGYLCNFGGASSMITGFASTNTTNYASTYASKEAVIQSALETFLSNLE